MRPTISKKVSNIEIKNAGSIRTFAEEQRRKKAEALGEWRQKNAQRLAWELFYLIEGPVLEHPNEYKSEPEDDAETVAFNESHLAYFDMLNRVKEYGIDEDGYLNMLEMPRDVRAFAVCLEYLFWEIADADDGRLLDRALFRQAIALGLGIAYKNGEITTAEVVQKIDEHRGGPEWRQICDTNESQAGLDVRFDIPSITEIPLPGNAWVDPHNRR